MLVSAHVKKVDTEDVEEQRRKEKDVRDQRRKEKDDGSITSTGHISASLQCVSCSLSHAPAATHDPSLTNCVLGFAHQYLGQDVGFAARM